MTIGASILLLALGAILRWGVADRIEGLDLSVIGLILMVAGAIGLLIGLFLNWREDETVQGRTSRWPR